MMPASIISGDTPFNPSIVRRVIGGKAKITVAITPALEPIPKKIATKIKYEKCGRD